MWLPCLRQTSGSQLWLRYLHHMSDWDPSHICGYHTCTTGLRSGSHLWLSYLHHTSDWDLGHTCGYQGIIPAAHIWLRSGSHLWLPYLHHTSYWDPSHICDYHTCTTCLTKIQVIFVTITNETHFWDLGHMCGYHVCNTCLNETQVTSVAIILAPRIWVRSESHFWLRLSYLHRTSDRDLDHIHELQENRDIVSCCTVPCIDIRGIGFDLKIKMHKHNTYIGYITVSLC